MVNFWENSVSKIKKNIKTKFKFKYFKLRCLFSQLSPCLVGHLWDSSTVIRTTTQNPSRRRGTQPAGDTFESRSELTQHRGLKNYGKSLHGLAADMNRSSLAPETTTTENGGNGNEVVETEMTKV